MGPCMRRPATLFLWHRSKKATAAFTHTREKARGLIAGTPDTLLLIPGLPCILVELKAPGNAHTGRQNEVGSAIALAGPSWNWCNSIRGYMDIIAALGVPLLDRAADLADKHDAVLAAAATRRAMAPRKRPATRKPGLRFEWGRAATKRATKTGVRL
jgi:hypothetical protein